MKFDLLDQIGDWNPQFFREIKGRLTVRNVLLTLGAAILGQIVFLISILSRLPNQNYYRRTGSYCRAPVSFEGKYCPPNLIDYPLWWQEHSGEFFAQLSIISIFLLLVAGTFLIINDLGREKQRGTLNFIKLSPQSSNSILVGKILGVPILLYIAVLSTLPISLSLGIISELTLMEILGVYGIFVASCAFYFSAVLLFSLISPKFNGFQAWLGSGLISLILWITNYGLHNTQGIVNWLNLFSPFYYGDTQNWQWFFFPIGQTQTSLDIFILFNYALCTYWIWQGLNRCFRSPNLALISKIQSYRLISCFNLFLLGFILQESVLDKQYLISQNIASLGFFNLLLIIGAIALLSPERQALIDWARYHHEDARKKSLLQDLIEGEKSPSVVAVALNLFLIAIPLLTLVMMFMEQDKYEVTFAILFTISLLLIYATITQLMLMMKSKRRSLWAVLTIFTLQILPPFLFSSLRINVYENPILWLFSTLPWIAIGQVSYFQLSLTVLGQLLVFTGLNLYLTRKLHLLGESELKSLIASSKSSF